MTAAWTSRTSTCGSPVSQVIARSASWSASRWTASMSRWSSASVIGWSGFLRSWLWVVVKPLTSSPAIPMTTWVGRKPAISSASWSATAQLSTTAAMSATVPDCMCDRPCRLRPTPRTVPWPSGSMSKTSALANSVPTSSAVQAANASLASRCQIRRQKAIRPRSRDGPGSRPAHRPAPSRRVPRPWAMFGRPPPRPPSAGIAALTRSPAEIPRATRSSETVTNSCGSSASSASAMTPEPSTPFRSRAVALSASIESDGRAAATNRTPGATSTAPAARSPGLGGRPRRRP